jgi:hypothetical protein
MCGADSTERDGMSAAGETGGEDRWSGGTPAADSALCTSCCMLVPS